MDLAEGRHVFTGRGQKPSNKEVLAAFTLIKKCRQGSFFNLSAYQSCQEEAGEAGTVRHMIRELDVGAMWHACVLWEETPHVFLLVLTAAC